jgi:hypothetical protein
VSRRRLFRRAVVHHLWGTGSLPDDPVGLRHPAAIASGRSSLLIGVVELVSLAGHLWQSRSQPFGTGISLSAGYLHDQVPPLSGQSETPAIAAGDPMDSLPVPHVCTALPTCAATKKCASLHGPHCPTPLGCAVVPFLSDRSHVRRHRRYAHQHGSGLAGDALEAGRCARLTRSCNELPSVRNSLPG